MSNLISGKEALIALANGEEVEFNNQNRESWHAVESFSNYRLDEFLEDKLKFRLKPKTITLNGIEVAQLVSSEWCIDNPNKVVLEFSSQEDASYFSGKALNIFNNCK